jgi:hypothetical protein
LSKRQRTLYEDYMANSSTRETLASGNFLGIINCLMQLRKVRIDQGGRAIDSQSSCINEGPWA